MSMPPIIPKPCHLGPDEIDEVFNDELFRLWWPLPCLATVGPRAVWLPLWAGLGTLARGYGAWPLDRYCCCMVWLFWLSFYFIES